MYGNRNGVAPGGAVKGRREKDRVETANL